MKRLPLLLAVLFLLPGFQQEGTDFYTDKENGFLIYKPVKDQEWEIKTEKTKLQGVVVAVNSRVKDLSVEIGVERAKKGTNYDLKGSLENVKKDFKKNYKEVTASEIKKMKFPGTGDQAYMAEFDLVTNDGKKFMWIRWFFKARKNGFYYTVHVVGSREVYEDKKYKKKVRWILGKLIAFKV